MRNKDINFKKSYSKEVFSLEGKKIFSTFLFLSFLLLIFFFLFVSCQNGFCPKKIGSILDNGITGKVIDSSGDFNYVYEDYSSEDFDSLRELKRKESILNFRFSLVIFVFCLFVFFVCIFYLLFYKKDKSASISSNIKEKKDNSFEFNKKFSLKRDRRKF